MTRKCGIMPDVNNDDAMLKMIELSDGNLLADATPEQVQGDIDMYLERVRILSGLLRCVNSDAPSMSEGFASARADALRGIENMRSTLKEKFTDAAKCRQRKAQEFPDDVRNMASIGILKTLANTTDGVGSDILDALLTLFAVDDNLVANEILGESIRQVGFAADYDDAEGFVYGLVESLTPIVAARKEDRLAALRAAEEVA